MAPDYDHLTLMQKVEVFEHALEHTQGDDLAKILWYKSPSSEVCTHPIHPTAEHSVVKCQSTKTSFMIKQSMIYIDAHILNMLWKYCGCHKKNVNQVLGFKVV